ncbi:MAG: hypothetical protein M1828_001150 [Chrysothrix sp. TS-e1954]|nr:MAG: hypothetical protein M1828_001150 [Chrysothrix sp. TS-e1954]
MSSDADILISVRELKSASFGFNIGTANVSDMVGLPTPELSQLEQPLEDPERVRKNLGRKRVDKQESKAVVTKRRRVVDKACEAQDNEASTLGESEGSAPLQTTKLRGRKPRTRASTAEGLASTSRAIDEPDSNVKKPARQTKAPSRRATKTSTAEKEIGKLQTRVPKSEAKPMRKGRKPKGTIADVPEDKDEEVESKESEECPDANLVSKTDKRSKAPRKPAKSLAIDERENAAALSPAAEPSKPSKPLRQRSRPLDYAPDSSAPENLPLPSATSPVSIRSKIKPKDGSTGASRPKKPAAVQSADISANADANGENARPTHEIVKTDTAYTLDLNPASPTIPTPATKSFPAKPTAVNSTRSQPSSVAKTAVRDPLTTIANPSTKRSSPRSRSRSRQQSQPQPTAKPTTYPKTRPHRFAIHLQEDSEDTSELGLGAYLDKYPEPKIPSALVSGAAFGRVRWRM